MQKMKKDTFLVPQIDSRDFHATLAALLDFRHLKIVFKIFVYLICI